MQQVLDRESTIKCDIDKLRSFKPVNPLYLPSVIACMFVTCGLVLVLSVFWKNTLSFVGFCLFPLYGGYIFWRYQRDKEEGAIDSGRLANLFQRLKPKCHEQIDHINTLIEDSKHTAIENDPIFAEVCHMPAKITSTTRQRMVWWWWFTIPFQVVHFVLGLPIHMYFKPDDDEVNIWKSYFNSFFCQVFVKPWIALLFRSVAKETHTKKFNEVIPRVVNIPNTEFIRCAMKRQSRAVTKVGADYLAVSMPFGALHPGVVTPKYFHFVRDKMFSFDNILVRALMFILLLMPLLVVITVASIIYSLLFWTLVMWCYPVLIGPCTLQLVDITRGLIVCDSGEAFKQVIDVICKSDKWEVVRIKNSLLDEGYGQIMINLKMKLDLELLHSLQSREAAIRSHRAKTWDDKDQLNAIRHEKRNLHRLVGHICEIQITHRVIYDWRVHTHLPYQVIRANTGEAFLQDLVIRTAAETETELERGKAALNRLKMENEKLKTENANLRAIIGAKESSDAVETSQ
eukprot:c4566_g1_i1.p1 GENE.c4566_g1_i1~~c4566_g1_i1.p1  ORF type:complete len:514 (+),score=109.67 c4566_g1_i1:175-1716(+)